MVKKIIGFDANALYLWCLSQLMHCGKLFKSTVQNLDVNEIIKDIKENILFGFIKCDIDVPKELYNKFSEMCPIFVNIDVENKKEIIQRKPLQLDAPQLHFLLPSWWVGP